MKPLDGILVLDFSQFLSGPSASLRLADLGARVIKIERPDGGDLCRRLYVSNLVMNGESSIFHAINRNKESFAADLKNADDFNRIRQLIERADVMVHNFRPGVIQRLGLEADVVRKWNPRIVYGEISGYGKEGPWKDKPGQDLLLQSLSGLTWLSGNRDNGPVPMGIAVADLIAGAHLVQGILACLVRRGVTGEGGIVEVSMFESILDFQFETVTTYFNDGGQPPVRTLSNNAHAYLGAPYGIYRTRDGYLSLAMGSIPELGRLLQCPALEEYVQPASWFEQRDTIKEVLAAHLATRLTAEWLSVLEPADIWCADVLDWNRLIRHEGFTNLQMAQEVRMRDGFAYRTTRCPIRINGERMFSDRGSPRLGGDNSGIALEFGLNSGLEPGR